MLQESGDAFNLYDAFELLCLQVIQLEAFVNAANSAMDDCEPPASESRRLFDRAHALISTAAEKAAMGIELITELKNSFKAAVEDAG